MNDCARGVMLQMLLFKICHNNSDEMTVHVTSCFKASHVSVYVRTEIGSKRINFSPTRWRWLQRYLALWYSLWTTCVALWHNLWTTCLALWHSLWTTCLALWRGLWTTCFAFWHSLWTTYKKHCCSSFHLCLKLRPTFSST